MWQVQGLRIGRNAPLKRPCTHHARTRARACCHHVQARAGSDAVGGRTKPGALNRSILDGPTFQPVRQPFQPTVPVSPMLRTKHLHHDTAPSPREEPRYHFRARPMPHGHNAGQ